MTAQREAIAYHEAGHAVISMKLGYKCLYVTIIPHGDRMGHVCCEDPLLVDREDQIKDAMKVIIAAGLSEGEHLKHVNRGDAEDRLRARKLALMASNDDSERAEALLSEVVSEARQSVEHHWSEIKALAQQLLINQRVNFLGA